MVPSKTSQCILSKSGVFMSLCAMDYHNVSCQNARAAITQRCIVIDQILGWGLKVTWASELKWTANRLWKDDREHFQDTESTEGQEENLRGRSWGAWNKESGKRKRGAALVSKAKPGPGRRGKRKGEKEVKKQRGGERARGLRCGLGARNHWKEPGTLRSETQTQTRTLTLRVWSGSEACPRPHCREEAELGQIYQTPPLLPLPRHHAPTGRSKDRDGVGNCHLSQLRAPGMVKEVAEGRWVYNLNTNFHNNDSNTWFSLLRLLFCKCTK